MGSLLFVTKCDKWLVGCFIKKAEKYPIEIHNVMSDIGGR